MMKTTDKKQKHSDDSPQPAINEEVTVRGSGFTYTEEEERTDKSIPLSEVKKEEVVQPPGLGKKNRP